MPEVMLRPNWAGGRFQRTLKIVKGKKVEPGRTIVFNAGTPVEVTEPELKALAGDIGIALFEVERDEKNRPRFVESVDETPTAKPEAKSVADV
jgi:hypothetical protein